MTTTITRRSVLKGTGLLGAALATGATFGRARAAQPVKFAGWTFKPETVQDYVTLYNQKFSGDVKYETVPWPQYHPSVPFPRYLYRARRVDPCRIVPICRVSPSGAL